MDQRPSAADCISDFESRFKVRLPERYHNIPKSVFAFLAMKHLPGQSESGREELVLLERVLFSLSAKEADDLAHGGELSRARSIEMSKELGLPLESVQSVLSRYWMFWNEGLRF
ncbi:MAG: hypothetical protein AAFX06_23905 [Planctomycetota bacterium]